MLFLCNVYPPLKHKHHIRFFLPLLFALLMLQCIEPSQKQATSVSDQETSHYLNHADSARYVGIQTCKLCHQAIYETFSRTGMGKSFDRATHAKSSALVKGQVVKDPYLDLNYCAYWDKDSLYIHEYRMGSNDTLYSRREQVNYIVGSGQHTNSHLQLVNGYLNQMPMTFYTQKKTWDLPPGFENNTNTRFTRKIGLECMTCHNGYPSFVAGSENKYSMIPNGIDCERCHGPGSIHVAQRSTGSRIDTSRYIDYSIVNPAKLPVDLQFDICQRCHLQGNAILKEGKSFLDFKPGKHLSEILSVFLPKYANADDEFIMASHADRLKQSACFIKSYDHLVQKNQLKPYKDAMTCVTCHNPHVSVKESAAGGFIKACLSCHYENNKALVNCSDKKVKQQMTSARSQNTEWDFQQIPNCITCHMPVSGSTDIPHVTVHDHYIRKPISKGEQQKIKTFLGLFSVNEKSPDPITKAKAYLNQFEKFEQKGIYLDSAAFWLSKAKSARGYKQALIQLLFMKQAYSGLVNEVKKWEAQSGSAHLFADHSLDNKDAWTCYRIAESYTQLRNNTEALRWYRKSTELAPLVVEFRNKYATSLANKGDLREAKQQYEIILRENPKYVSSYTNLGYLSMLEGNSKQAFTLYSQALALDPDNEALLMNLAAYFLSLNKKNEAALQLQHLLKMHPGNKQAREVLLKISSTHGS